MIMWLTVLYAMYCTLSNCATIGVAPINVSDRLTAGALHILHATAGFDQMYD